MASSRDLFLNFDRMRREMDQLFGDLWERAGSVNPGRESRFAPRVDVYYCGDDPPRAVVKVDLAGVDKDAVAVEVSGRTLTISGERAVQETEGRVYQQLEIATGPFVRRVELSADVKAEDAKATYEQGMLRIELPLARSESPARQVPVERATP